MPAAPSTDAPPKLFNTHKAHAILARAQKLLALDATVQAECEASLLSRLQEFLNFSPKNIALIGLYTPSFLQAINALYPQAKVIQLPLNLETPFDHLHQPIYDLVLHINALHHVNDLPGVFVQCYHALHHEGLLLSCLYGENTLQEMETFLIQSEEAHLNKVFPRTMPKIDVKTLGQLLTRAGFTNPVTDVLNFQLEHHALPDLIWDIRRLGLSSSLAATRSSFSKAFASKLAKDFPSPFISTFDVLFLTTIKIS